jgi:hypothetical protein
MARRATCGTYGIRSNVPGMAQGPTERLNANVLAVLDDSGKSKSALARAVGLGRRSIYRRFDDAESWTYAELIRAAAFLGVPVSTLTDGVEELYTEAEADETAEAAS